MQLFQQIQLKIYHLLVNHSSFSSFYTLIIKTNYHINFVGQSGLIEARVLILSFFLTASTLSKYFSYTVKYHLKMFNFFITLF